VKERFVEGESTTLGSAEDIQVSILWTGKAYSNRTNKQEELPKKGENKTKLHYEDGMVSQTKKAHTRNPALRL